jgi:SAM-dependent methyltransferase
MQWFILFVSIIVLLFGFVLLVGPPYLPTLSKQVSTALDLLELEQGQILLELGSGDGRVLKAAARRGIKGVGIELNPLLVLISKLRLFKYRKKVKIIWGNYWTTPWPTSDAIFTFMLDRYMKKLNTRLLNNPNKPIKLASFAFQIPDKKPIKQKNGVFLYEYRE